MERQVFLGIEFVHFAMLEDIFLEEDIWEYKSKRKPKPVHSNNCSENIPKSVEKATDGKHQSKRNRNKKRTVEANEKAKAPEMCLGETASQTSLTSSQNSDGGDGVQQCQDQETTPGKHSRTQKNKHVSPKIRPVYDGYCPNCQMPFSALLGQTPRWHVFECLDSPPVSETGVGFPLAEQLDSQNNSEHINLPLPENDFSNCEISYSPLQSDEETCDIDENLDDSQQQVFFMESSEDGSLEEDDSSSTLLKKLHDPFLKDQEDNCSEVDSFLTQDKYNKELYKCNTLNDSSQLTFQNKSILSRDNPAYTDDDFMLFPPALGGVFTSPSYQATKAKPEESAFHSSQSSKKKQVMKQMDIGVYFGLPPKRKEEKSLEENALEEMNLNAVVSPNEKRSRQCKRKAEKSLAHPVLQITGNLVKSKLRVQEQYIHPLPIDTECIVNGVKIVLLDANHCPGAVMVLFRLPNGHVILHTGDFRADPTMERSLLADHRVHTLYLDTTYCSPEYTFPSQQEVIQFAINTAFETVTLNPRALVVCGTYSIGKEKVFLAIADVLGSKVGMSKEKYKTLQCLNIPEMNSLITTDMCNSLVHLLPMMQINFKVDDAFVGLQNHLKTCGGKYNQVLAFRPTGWTHSNKLTSVADVIPQTKGNISIYGIPYSEHSSYLEMKRFVQWLKPQKIIPTVNVGTSKSRSTMEKYFKEWKLEAGY
ncbi:DNA cross-link repair 1A protein [Camelus dromedarius]|uniref:DNA cross-link repair 1A protein n=1 Tax=Camelus dromedarius TaxID=9838 RepID=A0A5N4DJR1_CAMDR|nr:DNA cross-link repair 1A protein [Camelus dromedarius]